METTCIVCPVGCNLTIEKIGDDIIVNGNGCVRGIEYGKSEYSCPKRIVTALVKGEDQVCSIKTTCPVQKTKIKDVLLLLKNAPKIKYKVGDVVYKNIFDSGCDIIITSVNEND